MTEKKPPAKRPPRTAAAAQAEQRAANVVEIRPGSGRTAGTKGRRGAPRGAKTSPKAITVAERRARAVALRRAGASFVQIGDTIRAELALPQYTNKSAWEDVREALDHYQHADVGHYVNESIERLRFGIMAVWPQFARGDLDAVHAVIAIEKRLAALIGMDAAKRVQLSGPDGGPIPITFVPINDPEEAYGQALTALDEILGPPRELPGG